MLIIMVNKLKGLVVEENGQGMTEYGLVLGLIAIAAVGALVLLRDEIVEMFDNVANMVQNRETGGTEPTL
jgi:pilus assembly protein Flp/PilA